MAQTTPRPPKSRATQPPRPRTRTPLPLPAPRRPRRQRPIRRWIALLCLGIVAGLAMYGGFAYRDSAALQKYLGVWFRHGLRQPSVTEAFGGRPSINLMVIGRDRDYSDQDQILKSQGRSDLLMMAHLDFAKRRVDLLSIPRDTRARIPGHGETKINAAHKWGGPALSEQTVRANFGIPTDDYVSLDFNGFEKAIDLMGGVDLTVDKKMDYDDNWGHLHIHLNPGFQHLTGEQAIGFVRFRHSDSDLMRVQRQQALLAALKTKLRRPRTLALLPQLLDTLDAHLNSDLTTDQKLALARFLHDTPHDHIQMATLPSRESSSGVTTDWSQAGPVITQMFHVSRPQVAEQGSERRLRRHRRHTLRFAERP